ncbi:MAG: hypothetical protein AAB316_13265, partial [Bacteroidota bacterium]
LATVDKFEVEMQITPSRVRAFSCECKTFQDSSPRSIGDKMCGHVAAGLLALRRRLAERQAEKPAKPEKPRQPVSYQKLSVNAILENANRDDLDGFIRQFAKSNRNFLLSLKARFAAAVPMFDSREKYAQLLDEALQAARKKDDRISAIGGIQLLKMLKELAGQADDAFSLEHFAEGWSIVQAVIEKITPVLRKVESERTNFNAVVSQAFDRLERLLEKSIPPALREEIWMFCLQECTRPAYRLNHLSHRFFDALHQLADDPGKLETLLQTFDNELAKANLAMEYRSHLVIAKLRLLEKQGMEQAAQTFTLDMLSSPELLLFVVETALAKGLPDQAQSLAEKGLRFIHQPEFKARLDDILLLLALGRSDRETISTLALSRFFDTKDPAYFQQVKENFEGDWTAFFSEKILLPLQKLPPSTANIELLATLLSGEERWDDLLQLIENQNSLELLQRYDHHLLKHRRAQVQQLYQVILEQYLATHFGVVPTEQLRKVINHLHRLQAADVAAGLMEKIKRQFSERALLVES